MLKIALAAAVLIIVIVVVAVQLRTPRADRDWVRELSRAPVFEAADDGRWLLHDLRAFEYRPGAAPVEMQPYLYKFVPYLVKSLNEIFPVLVGHALDEVHDAGPGRRLIP